MMLSCHLINVSLYGFNLDWNAAEISAPGPADLTG